MKKNSNNRVPSFKPSKSFFSLLFISIAGLDLLLQTLCYQSRIPLSWVWNEGVGFGISSKSPFLPIILSSAGLFLLLIFIANRRWQTLKISIGLCAILAGSSSNFISRLLNHGVVDYIPLPWQWINGADVIITVGAILIVFSIFFEHDTINSHIKKGEGTWPRKY